MAKWWEGEELEQVTRFVVIDETGRPYERSGVLSGGDGVSLEISFQDDGRTLKVFVRNREEQEAHHAHPHTPRRNPA